MASLQTSRPPRSMRAAAVAALEILALDRVFSAGPRSFVSWRGWSGDEVTRRGGFSEQFSTGGMRAWTISQRCEDNKRLSGIFLRNFFYLGFVVSRLSFLFDFERHFGWGRCRIPEDPNSWLVPLFHECVCGLVVCKPPLG